MKTPKEYAATFHKDHTTTVMNDLDYENLERLIACTLAERVPVKCENCHGTKIDPAREAYDSTMDNTCEICYGPPCPFCGSDPRSEYNEEHSLLYYFCSNVACPCNNAGFTPEQWFVRVVDHPQRFCQTGGTLKCP